ncbi:MAG: presqualene diphosphate synthase HpnD [Alphaproteobacteria bacterium]
MTPPLPETPSTDRPATGPCVTVEEARAHARAVVDRSGTSFGLGMRILPKARRDAMFAIYAFCREIDDIADEEGTPEEKHAALDAWRAEINALYAGRPRFKTAVALEGPIADYGLEREEFILLIEGMEMDVDGPIRAPSMDTLLAYCRRVAGAVGRLSMPVFGAPAGQPSDDFALALADALQLTNILRDVQTDASIGRLYLPGDYLEAHGIASIDPQTVADHPQTPAVCRAIGAIARERFATARRAMEQLDWRVLRPALLMMGMYEETLRRLEQRDFRVAGEPVALSKWTKLAIAARYAVAPPLHHPPGVKTPT